MKLLKANSVEIYEYDTHTGQMIQMTGPEDVL